MKRILFLFSISLLLQIQLLNAQTLWLDEIQVSLMESGWGVSTSNKSVEGRTFTVAGKKYQRGIGTHAVSKIIFDLKSAGIQFSALVGVDDEAGDKASVEFFVLGDKKVLWNSGTMKKGDAAKKVEVSLKNLGKLALLVTDADDGIDQDHADWIEAKIEYKAINPMVFTPQSPKPYLLTPTISEIPGINYPRITGARPGKPFLFTIPATGKQPLNFAAENLPDGLILDKSSGIISGYCQQKGIYKVKVTVFNELGSDVKTVLINIGNKLALTPPMGWNSSNCCGLKVDDAKVRAAADAMAGKLAGHGWTYVNIDDGWAAEKRDNEGNLHAKAGFPDMKALGDYIHDKGLKFGISASPGETTCGGFPGSYRSESRDAQTWGAWGVDYLKYDWCSYEKIAKDNSLSELKKPYLVMRDAMKATNRDIIFSLNLHGLGNVWEWGETVEGNLWRTAAAITDSWKSMAGKGFSQATYSPYAKPGAWNDPGLLVVGKLGSGQGLQPARLTPDEQYTQISLWCLLSAPLLMSFELNKLDDFTLGLLTNDEVLGINQDPRGNQAVRMSAPGADEVWVKNLEDGSLAVGVFYTKPENEGVAAEFQWDDVVKPKKITVNWAQLGIFGSYQVRDLWRQKDLGVFHEKLEPEINWHGCMLYKLTKVN